MNAETKGRKAQEILDSEVYVEAQESAAQTIKNEWAAAKTPGERESLWHQLQALGATTKALRVIAGRGDFAAHTRQRQEKLNA